jgi:quercetin dioxygenase-like cupin family protein
MNNKKIQSLRLGHWQDIETKSYKTESNSFKDVVRHTLIDKQSLACPSELRYFEVGVGGYSSLEKHQHTHIVIFVQGKARVILGEEVLEAQAHDVFYVAPWQAHQFIQAGEEPLGFYCLVPKDRDRPNLLSPEEQIQYREKFGAKI